MELVFENGQIFPKSQRSNDVYLQNPRMKSIMDLYEAEYSEDFEKSLCMNPYDGSNKNLEDTQVDNENRENIEFIPPDEQSIVAERSIEMDFDSMDFTEEGERSTYLSSSLDDTRLQVPARTRKALVKRRRSKENSPEENKRNEINKKMRTLQYLVPNSHKADKESLLDEAISYMTTLKYQIQMMSMSNRYVTPSMMLPLGPHYSQMGLATAMQMGVPQFHNHPGLMPMQNSALYTPRENCLPQPVPPSSAAFPNQIQNITSLSNLDDARTDGRILSDKRI